MTPSRERLPGARKDARSGQNGNRSGGEERSGRSRASVVGRDHVADIQRGRMVAAMTEIVAEGGIANSTVAHVVALSGVSRRTFYEVFEDREDCFFAAFDRAIEQISARVVPAYEHPASWAERIRASLAALLEFLDDEPGMARLVIVETLGAGAAALERRSRVLALMVTAIDDGRGESKRGNDPPPLAAEGVVGAVFSVIHTRLSEPRRSPLVELLNPLMGMIVLPYLGPALAAKEMQREAPKAEGKSRTRLANPLKDLEMRLTYRTVRVLMTIGSHPGVSNRRVADESGITDQGQISKLLARLDHLGLIENSGFGQAKGESNSWYLTQRGREIEGAIREQTDRR